MDESIATVYRDQPNDLTVFNSDCFSPTGLTCLSDDSIDVCITDPPYTKHVHEKSMAGNAEYGRERKIDFEYFRPSDQDKLAYELNRLVKRWTLIFCAFEDISNWKQALEKRGLEYIRTGVWHKIGAAPQFSGDRPAANTEAIVIAHRKGKKYWNGHGEGSFWSYKTARMAGEQTINETQKPLALISTLVLLFSDPHETILDPLAGSGTLPAACKILRRKAICYEKRESQFASLTNRLNLTL